MFEKLAVKIGTSLCLVQEDNIVQIKFLDILTEDDKPKNRVIMRMSTYHYPRDVDGFWLFDVFSKITYLGIEDTEMLTEDAFFWKFHLTDIVCFDFSAAKNILLSRLENEVNKGGSPCL